MDTERFLLQHPVNAQRVLREIAKDLPEEKLNGSALIIVFKVESDEDSAVVESFCGLFKSQAERLGEQSLCYAIGDLRDDREKLMAAWATDGGDQLVDLLQSFWEELQQAAVQAHMVGGIGLTDYSAICTLRTGPIGSVSLHDEFMQQLSNSGQERLRELGYVRSSGSEAIEREIWNAFIQTIKKPSSVAVF